MIGLGYTQLDKNENAIWSLLLASGYLKVINCETEDEVSEGNLPLYHLQLTNYEVKRMFEYMIHDWFSQTEGNYNDFIKALLLGDVDAMNDYMNLVSLQMFSSFDTGKMPSASQPERFYHGFVLGLMVDLKSEYIITSNRESGFGRYDIVIEPKDKKKDAIIIEFKVYNRRREKSLDDTLKSALQQIEDMKYDTALIAGGIPPEHIRKYGFAFKGKEVLIG